MGIIAYVYRNAYDSYDCTNGGVSSQYTRLCIVNAEGPFDSNDDAPPALLVRHPTMNHVYVVPEEAYNKGIHTMFGGNFAHSSDSRFGEAVRKVLNDPYASVGAIQIHDRIE